MIRFALTIFLTFVAFGAHAQGTIRTGEHGRYTRVVVPIGADREFSLQSQGDTRVVTLLPEGSFNTERVFRTLFTERLLEIDSDGDISLQMGCDCEILAFRYEEEYLVLDIYEMENFPGPLPQYPSVANLEESSEQIAAPPIPIVALPEDAPTIERALAARQPYRPSQPLDIELLPSPDWTIGRLAPLNAPPMETATREGTGPEVPVSQDEEETVVGRVSVTASDENAEMAEAIPSPTDAPSTDDSLVPMTNTMADEDQMVETVVDLTVDEPRPMTDPVVAPAEGLDDTIDSLAQQLARAAAAGLLESSGSGSFGEDTQIDPTQLEEDAPEDSLEDDPPSTGLPVRAANAFDVAGSRDGGLAAMAAALSCAHPIANLDSWPAGESFDSELGTMRQAAFDNNGSLLRNPTIALARHFIFHGFGAEAEAWLIQLEDPPETELAMARYLDERPGPNFPEVETLALCSGLDLLWRFVDSPDFPELAPSQRQEMRLAFSELPLGLRRLLGPDFVRRLTSEGYEDDAVDVREALARGPTLDETETLVLQFETSEAPPTRSATEALENQLETAGPDAARVMREFLSALRRAGDQPDDSRMIAAEALLRESAPDQSVDSLWYEVLMARTSRGEIEEAFAMIEAMTATALGDRRVIETNMVSALLRADQTAALVVLATRLANAPDGHDLQRDQRNSVYEVLMGLGLEDLATPYGTPEPGIESGRPMVGQNWAASAGTESVAANVARRVADLEAGERPFDPENPDDVRTRLDDSRALRAELSELLGDLPTN